MSRIFVQFRVLLKVAHKCMLNGPNRPINRDFAVFRKESSKWPKCFISPCNELKMQILLKWVVFEAPKCSFSRNFPLCSSTRHEYMKENYVDSCYWEDLPNVLKLMNITIPNGHGPRKSQNWPELDNLHKTQALRINWDYFSFSDPRNHKSWFRAS